MRKNDKDKHEEYSSEGMGIGLCLGVAMSTALHFNVALGMMAGMILGLVIGSSIGEKKRMDCMNDSNEGFIIRRLSLNEIPAALELALKVFSEYESQDYDPKGTEEFRKCLRDEEYLAGIEYYGAFDGEKLIGTIGFRADKKHICFFFVDGEYHRKGIGTGMFHYLLEDYSGKTITVNSSPYGVPFYRAVGFVPTDEEKTVNGIRFTPMEYRVEWRH